MSFKEYFNESKIPAWFKDTPYKHVKANKPKVNMEIAWYDGDDGKARSGYIDKIVKDDIYAKSSHKEYMFTTKDFNATLIPIK